MGKGSFHGYEVPFTVGRQAVPYLITKKSAETRAANRERARRQREARGVLLIAFGVLLGVYLFVSGTGVLGAFLSRLLFGLCGWFAYVLPVVLIGAGVLAIAGRNGSSSGSAGWVLTGIVAALTLAQTAQGAAYKGSPYLAYLSAAYETGATYPHHGGGAIGALLCYPLQQLGGSALAYVLTIATLLIVILMVTRLSLRDLSTRVNQGVHSAVERVRTAEPRRLPVYDLQKPSASEQADKPDKKPRARRRQDGDLSDFNAFTADLPVPAEDRKVKRVAAGAAEEELTYLGDAPLQTRPIRKLAPEGAAEAARPEAPLPSGDAIWDELESAEDFPFAPEPVAPARARARRPAIRARRAAQGRRHRAHRQRGERGAGRASGNRRGAAAGLRAPVLFAAQRALRVLWPQR